MLGLHTRLIAAAHCAVILGAVALVATQRASADSIKHPNGGSSSTPPLPTIIDLTQYDSGIGNGAIYMRSFDQPTGTGVIDPFVRIQGDNGSKASGIQSGFNTDARQVTLDTKDNNHWTHSITVDDIKLVDHDGKLYRQFLLDINQQGNTDGRHLSLDSVQIYLANSPLLNDYPNLGTKIYDLDLDSRGDMSVLLNYRLNHGSGSGDMYLLVPDELFHVAIPAPKALTKPGSKPFDPDNPFVYLYSSFGEIASVNAGFEEWATQRNMPVHNPLPSAAWGGIALLAALAVGRVVRRRIAAA